MGRISQFENRSSTRDLQKHVIYLIGLPGVGKTTVGGLIAKKTGFVLLDHNVTYGDICNFLERGSRSAHVLNGLLHVSILETLISSGIKGVVSTLSIVRHPTIKTALNAVNLLEKKKIQVSFIKLECDWEEHQRRVRMPSRKLLHKTNTIKKLKTYLAQPCFEGLKSHSPIVINNTKIKAHKCADKIISILGLRTI